VKVDDGPDRPLGRSFQVRLWPSFVFLRDTGPLSIRRILGHLGLSPPEQAQPPPVRETLRVAEQGEGWGGQANWEE
jgi:hypothetical protein